MPISKLKAGSLGQSSVNSDNIVDGTIVNADISPSAAIASAKVPGIATLNTSISTLCTTASNVSAQVGKVENNIALLGFKMAVNDGLTVFNLVDGVVDEFHDESGTDEAEGSNDLYCATSDYYINSTQPTGVPSSTPYNAGFSMSAITEPDTSSNDMENPSYGEVTESSSYTVPTGITAVTAHVWGGGGGTSSPNSRSGYGGYARGTIAVTATQSIHVGVGEGGGTTPQTEGAGGGEGGTSEGRGGSGGMSYVGTADIYELSEPQYAPNQPNVFVVAGAGATATCGGGADGGGLTGYDQGGCAQTNNGPVGGGGGDQEQGGQGGESPDGLAVGQSGAAFKGGRASPQRGTGGGAGYFGGGGGSGQNHTNQSGGGGSSYYGHPQVTSGHTSDARSSPTMYCQPLWPSVNPLGVAAPGTHSPSDTAGGDGYVFMIACLAVSATTTATTIVSNAFTSTSVPTTSRIVVFEENVATPTLNTDIIASISRDGGSTFTNATLADSGYVTGSSGQRILTGSATISGQPSGQSMRWKLALANNAVKIHGVALQWN